MKNFVLLTAVASLLLMSSGCANGPLRQWLRGSACNTCQPPLGQPLGCGTNTAPGCENGTCGTGVIGAPASLPASDLSGPTSYYQENNPSGAVYQGSVPTDAYGNAGGLSTPTLGNPNFNPPIGPAGR